MIQEPDAGVDGDVLALGRLGSMVFYLAVRLCVLLVLGVNGVPEVGLWEGLEVATIDVERDLDLGLVGVAVEGGGSWHCGW